jgi:hypothetical protein
MTEHRIPSVEYNAETGTYKVTTWLLHPIHEKLGLDEDVVKSYLEKRKEQDKNVKLSATVIDKS